MIVTHFWDTLIIHVGHDDGRFEVRVGAGCLLLIFAVAAEAVQALLKRIRDE